MNFEGDTSNSVASVIPADGSALSVLRQLL